MKRPHGNLVTPPKPPTGGRVIKTAIIVDMMGAGGKSPEEEVEQHKEFYGDLLAPATLDVHRPYHAGGGKHGIQDGTELIVYDFGGMMPGSSLMEDNARQVVKWAQDHPSGLVVVASSYTFRVYVEAEMADVGLDGLHNVVCDDGSGEAIPEWFLNYAKGEG
ncbi:MAG TPA: hypothetical protein VF297_05355 [Pyrinomonadaceae bacterium]